MESLRNLFLGGLMLRWWNFLMTRIRVGSASTLSGFGGDGGNQRACSTVVESIKKRLLFMLGEVHDLYQGQCFRVQW